MALEISKWGNSAAIRLPKSLLERVSLHIGDTVNVVPKGRTLVIEPSRPTLEELLSKVSDENKHQDLMAKSMGNELL